MSIYLGTNKLSGVSEGVQIVGQIIQLACSSTYIPNGCLPCDGTEYSSSQFSQLWTNYLISNPAKLETCYYADYATAISTYGQCSKFGIDTINSKFKVPTLPNKLVTGQVQNVPVKGNGMTLGLTNRTVNVGLYTNSSNDAGISTNAYGVDADGINTTATSQTGKWGVTLDSSKSGIIADLSTNTVMLRSFVVVANGQINQSQMDWASWASSLSGKASTTLDNINASSSAKAAITHWSMPNYSAKIAISTNYTVTGNGYVTANAAGFCSLFLYVNGIRMGGTYTDHNGSSSGFVAVSAGDVITFDGSSVTTYFIPCFGG